MCGTDTWSYYIVGSHFPQLFSLGRKVISVHTDVRASRSACLPGHKAMPNFFL